MPLKRPERLKNIPNDDLKRAAAVEHNLELVHEPEVVDGQPLEYRANSYVHTGSHCREVARQMRAMFPDARRCAYKPMGSTCLQGSTITTVLHFMVAQLE